MPTVNIAIEFYKKICVSLNVNAEEMDKSIKVCVKENAFTEFRKAIEKSVPRVITTYSTASKCLGSIIELFYTKLKDRIGFYKPDGKTESNIEEIQTGTIDILYDYTLVIDEAHLLLENISLIEICREFNNVALFSATVDDISFLSVFMKHERKIYIHKLRETVEEQRKAIAEQVLEESKNYDKILIKVEDKKECENIKKEIYDTFKKALYYSDKKEVEISEQGTFINPSDVDVVIATSCIQAGQSLTENVLQIFIQTPLDTSSSV